MAVADHGPLTRQVADYERTVTRLAGLPDGGSGDLSVRIGAVVFAWRWYDGAVGRARGRWHWIARWRARRTLRAVLWQRKNMTGGTDG